MFFLSLYKPKGIYLEEGIYTLNQFCVRIFVGYTPGAYIRRGFFLSGGISARWNQNWSEKTRLELIPIPSRVFYPNTRLKFFDNLILQICNMSSFYWHLVSRFIKYIWCSKLSLFKFERGSRIFFDLASKRIAVTIEVIASCNLIDFCLEFPFFFFRRDVIARRRAPWL